LKPTICRRHRPQRTNSIAKKCVAGKGGFPVGGGLFTETGAALYSYGNNHVNGNNGNDGSFTGTIGQQ
jgi:hypothetical protein